MRSIEIPQPEERDKLYRLFEIIPAVLTFIVLSLPFTLSMINPKLGAYFILVYLLLWFFRAISLNIRAYQGFKLMNEHKRVNWPSLNHDLENLVVASHDAPKWHARNLARVEKNILPPNRIKPSDVYHAVIVCFWNESREVLEPTIESVVGVNYDPKKIILLVAYEQRGGEVAESNAKHLINKYQKHFHHAEAVMHPWPMFGEVIGKGGNATFAGRRLQKILKSQKIDPLHVLVTTLDADNRPDKEYFGALTYTYCSTEEPKNSSYQPIPMFLNNIWDAPAPMRVIATGNSMWNMVLSLRPHALRNFSAHAQPMAALIDTDFWSTRTIVEDGHQFWRTYFRYDGNHVVYPIYVPIYQDAVLTDKYTRTLKVQFQQVRRWAWGASDIAYVATKGFFTPNKIPRHKMIAKFWRLFEGHLGWSTAPLILLLAALVPFFLYSGGNSYQALIGNQLPQLASKLQTIAMVGILVTLFISFKSLPPKPARYKRHRNIWMLLQWVYLPITSIVYSSFAAINAQVRLMFKRYLGFIVTEKAVKK